MPTSNVPAELTKASHESWDQALELGKQHGYKNGQVTVLAPTGTIAFMMDCDTTGVEPDIALVKYKKLVGGGFLKIVNKTVPMALRKLGYSREQIDSIIAYIDERETIEMTLLDAIELALRHNLTVQVNRYNQDLSFERFDQVVGGTGAHGVDRLFNRAIGSH